MSITSKDIARLAGVSRSAVSAVLNGHYNKVSVEKREKSLQSPMTCATVRIRSR